MPPKHSSSVVQSSVPPRHPANWRPRNRLLARLSAADFHRIRPHLTTIPLNGKQTLLKRGEVMRYVYFPNGGVCSVTAMLKNGTAVEVATVGDEGVIGATAFFGGKQMPGECMVQVPDTNAERMPVAAFQAEIQRRGALHDGVSRYLQATMVLMTQSIVCVAVHQVRELPLAAHDPRSREGRPIHAEP